MSNLQLAIGNYRNSNRDGRSASYGRQAGHKTISNGQQAILIAYCPLPVAYWTKMLSSLFLFPPQYNR
jgi:hypothetical protein